MARRFKIVARRFKKFNDAELLFFTVMLTNAKELKMDELVKKSIGTSRELLKGDVDVDGIINELLAEVTRKDRS